MALGDVDFDGDLDLVLGRADYTGQQNRLYLNDGSGTFTDATATHMPVDADATVAVACFDADRDGLGQILGRRLGARRYGRKPVQATGENDCATR